jgi:NTE family protein
MGLHSGDGLTKWFQKIIKEVTGDENATFLDWHEKKMVLDHEVSAQKMKHLYIEACNIQSGFNEEFSHTSSHNDVPIALALSASMAYTGFFTPKEIKGKLYSDGGLQSDCPILLFEHIQGEPNPLMLAVWLDSLDRLKYIIHGDMPNEIEVKSLSQLLYSHAVAMYNVQLRNLSKSAYKDRLIYCDTLDVDNLDFTLSAERKDALIQSGIYGTVRFFMMNFPEYTSKHFDTILLEHMHALNYPISISEFESMPILVPGLHLSEVDDALGSHWHYLPQFNYILEHTQKPEATTSSANLSVKDESAPKDIDKLQEKFSDLEISPNTGWCTLI